MTMNFDNLFNDPTISQSLNQVFNDNQEILYNELRPAMNAIFSKMVIKMLAPIFSKFPYRDFFLEN